MHSIFTLSALLSTLHAAQSPSPVLPLELISRNAAGAQSMTALGTTPVGISANGSKIAFSVYDPVFLGETPAPPASSGAEFVRYGQVAIWQRGVPLRPLVRFPDGLGPNDGFPPKFSEVFFDKVENRICFVSYAGNLVTGMRGAMESLFCEKPDGSYEHAGYNLETGLPTVFSRFLGGNAGFDIYNSHNPFPHLALRNRRTGVMEYIDVNDQGELGQLTVILEPGVFSWPRLSDDGRFAVFASPLNNLVSDDNSLNDDGSDIFIRDRVLRTTRRITRSDGSEFLGNLSGADIAGNGSIVLFVATGDIVEPCLTGTPDPRGGRSLYSYEIATRTLECISVNDDNQAMGSSNLTGSDVSADGRFVLFNSNSPLHPEDTNNSVDQFIRDRVKKRTYWVSQAHNGAAGNGRSATGMLSDDGNWLVFSSLASNLVPGDQNGTRVDVFLRDLRPLKVEPLAVPANGLGSIILLAGLALVAGLARLRHS